MYATASTRYIPEDLAGVAKLMKSGGSRVSEIHRVLKQAALDTQREITWIYEDIQTRFGPSAAEKRFDASNFGDLLRERWQLAGYYFKIRRDKACDD